MSQTVNKKKQVFLKKIVFSSQIQNKENQVDHLMTETPLMELEKEKSPVTEDLKSPTLAQDNSKQEYCKIIDKSHSENSELVSKKSYSSNGFSEQLKKYSKRKSTFSLKNVLINMRVQNLRNNFIQKVKLNNMNSAPITEADIWGIQNCQQEQQLNSSLLKIWKLCYITAILGVFFSLSFSIAFKQLKNNPLINYFVIFGIITTSVQIVLYLSKIMSLLKRNSMRSLQQKPVILLQTTTQFTIFLNLILFFTGYNSFAFRQISLILCLSKIAKLSSYSLFIRQKYINCFMLSKIFQFFILLISNLLFAHVITVILNYIISNHQSNWQVNKQIYEKQWRQRYIWSYYWALISIAKIGVQFTPNNNIEVVWFIIVQILCFAIFVYNINQITTILGFRKKILDNSRRASILQNMIETQDFSYELTYKIRQAINPDYVKYCQKTKQQNEILNELPIELQKQISTQKNHRLLYGTLSFLMRYSTIQEMAIKMKKYKYYPEQIIRHYSDPHNIYILQNGTVSYVSLQGGWRRKMEGNIIIKDKQAFLLNWDFITMENMSFNIQAKTISTVGKINYEDFMSSLKLKSYEFEYYCFLRDKSKHILGQFETVYCRFCQTKHTAFTCHKMHYIPLKQNIIYRYFANLKQSQSNPRVNIQRISMRKIEALKSLEAYKYLYNNRDSYDRRNTIQNKFVKLQPYFYQNNQGDCYSKDLSIAIKMLNQNVFPFFEKYEDNMWGVATDACQNYRNYFHKDNIINMQRNIFGKQKAKN